MLLRVLVGEVDETADGVEVVGEIDHSYGWARREYLVDSIPESDCHDGVEAEIVAQSGFASELGHVESTELRDGCANRRFEIEIDFTRSRFRRCIFAPQY